MHISRYIDANRQMVFSTVTGEITVDEVRADMARIAADPFYKPDMPGIVDMRNATAALSANDLLELAEVVKRSKAVGHTKRALLVGSELMYGLYRMFASFASGGAAEYRVFRDETAARTWLEEKESEELVN